MATEVTRVQIVTDPVRISFPYLFKKREMKDQDGTRQAERDRYECVLLIPPSTGDAKKIADAMSKAMAAKFGDDWKSEMSSMEMAKLPLKKCSENKWFKDQFADWHFVNSWSKERPNVVDKDFNDIIDPEKVYAGCWCRFQLTLLAWESKKGGKLCLVSLDNVMFVADGDRLGGGKKSAKEGFGDKLELKLPEELKAAGDAASDDEGNDLF
jgi:hypothetical protein